MTRMGRVLATVAACLLVLAFGVALGAGPLQSGTGNALEQLGDDTEAAKRQTAVSAAVRRSLQYDDAFADELSRQLLEGRLTNCGVLVLATPDADPATVAGMSERIATAGGSITAQLRIREELLDPAARNLVDSLSTQLAGRFDDLQLPAAGAVYDRAGAVLARALVSDQGSEVEFDATSASVVSSFVTAGLLVGDTPQQRAGLVVLLTGPGPDRETIARAHGEIMNSLLRQLDAGGEGAVLAGPPSAAQGQGPLVATRRDSAFASAVSTVDSVNRAAGQVAAVLALVEQSGGGVGHYGVVGAVDGAIPPPG